MKPTLALTHEYRRTTRQVILLTLLAMFPFSTLAQKPGKQDRPSAPRQERPAPPPADVSPPDMDNTGAGEPDGPGGILRILHRLDLSREQRVKIHQIVDEADDDRIRITRKARNTADEIKAQVRKQIGSVFTDNRKDEVNRIIEEELSGSDKDKMEQRDEARGDRRRKPRDRQTPEMMGAHNRLKDRIFNEIQMSDAEAEKMLVAFKEVRKTGSEQAEKLREELMKLRDTTKAKVMALLTDEQKKQFEQEITRLKERWRNR